MKPTEEGLDKEIEKFNNNPTNFITMELLYIYRNAESEEIKIRALEGLLRCTAYL